MITLHHCHQTRSMRSLWLLHELGVDFDLVIHPFDKSLRSVEYLSLNPVGRVPALEMDGQTIWESGAIAQVLVEKYPEGGLGRAPDDRERGEWLIWLHFAETISQHSAALTQQHIALYDPSMRSPIITRLEAKRLKKCYGALEQRLDGRDYLLGGGYSAADIGVGQAVYMALHFARLDDYPNSRAWYERITARPAFKASLPPDGVVLLWEQDFYRPLDG